MKNSKRAKTNAKIENLTKQLSSINSVNDLDYTTYQTIKLLDENDKSFLKRFLKGQLLFAFLFGIGAFFIAMPFIFNATGMALSYPIVMGSCIVGTGLLSEGLLFSKLSTSEEKQLLKNLKKQKVWNKLTNLANEYEKTSNFKTEQDKYNEQQLKQKYEQKSMEADIRLTMADAQISLLSKKLQQLKEKNKGNLQAKFEDDSLLNPNAPITMEELEEIEQLIINKQALKSQIKQNEQSTNLDN